MAASNLRFGDGVTAEVGMDLKNMKARKVGSFSLFFFMFPEHFASGRRVYRPKRRENASDEGREWSLGSRPGIP